MSRNYIMSGKGFLKSTSFNSDPNVRKIEVEWTNSIREAKKFKKKTANNLIQKLGLEAFVWNPYIEEPIKGKWKVIKRSDNYGFYNDEHHKSLEWSPVKVKMESETDLKYLMRGGEESKVTYYDSYEEALEVSHMKNMEILEELNTKMMKMDNITPQSDYK